MKLMAPDGYLRPDVQLVLGLVLAACFLIAGIAEVTSRAMPDTFFGILALIGVPAWMYMAWCGYRKMKRSDRRAH